MHNYKPLESLTVRALISDGVECLELITYPLSNRMLQLVPVSHAG